MSRNWDFCNGIKEVSKLKFLNNLEKKIKFFDLHFLLTHRRIQLWHPPPIHDLTAMKHHKYLVIKVGQFDKKNEDQGLDRNDHVERYEFGKINNRNPREAIITKLKLPIMTLIIPSWECRTVPPKLIENDLVGRIWLGREKACFLEKISRILFGQMVPKFSLVSYFASSRGGPPREAVSS